MIRFARVTVRKACTQNNQAVFTVIMLEDSCDIRIITCLIFNEVLTLGYTRSEPRNQ